MSRVQTSVSLFVGGWTLCLIAGCGSLMTARTIQTFADSLAASDLAAMKAAASPTFDGTALRAPEAVDDFRILNLPKGRVSVVEIEEVSPTERLVKAEVGEQKKKLTYKLTRDPSSRRWVVDDIVMEQKKQGLDEPIQKSVVETMDLLLSVREFLDKWRTGGRDDVLSVTTPEFGDMLAGVSPTHLQQLTSHLVGSASDKTKYKPEAWLDGDQAGVLVPMSHGKLLVELRRHDGQWRVNDLALEAREEQQQVRSARKAADILRTTAEFMTAYEQGDLPELEHTASTPFHRSSLSVADLASVRLPVANLLAAPYKLRPHDDRAELVLEAGGTVYMLSFVPEGTDVSTPGRVFRIDELTIYDDDAGQVKRLSALFTAHAMTEIFAQALAARDLVHLQQASTTDFNQRVWDLVDDELLSLLPLDEIEPAMPHVVATIFQGAITEVTVTQGSRALTYVLRESRGRMAVDDVLLPVVNRPNSLKQNLRTIIPVIALARSVQNRDLASARRLSSPELNHLVWGPMNNTMSDLGCDVHGLLSTPINTLTMTEDRADLTLGTDHFGARIQLERRDQRFLVDDVQLIAGPDKSSHVDLKRVTRLNLAAGTP